MDATEDLMGATQGLARRQLKIEEIFEPSTLELVDA
jgi:ribosomal protein L20A (L18A)